MKIGSFRRMIHAHIHKQVESSSNNKPNSYLSASGQRCLQRPVFAPRHKPEFWQPILIKRNSTILSAKNSNVNIQDK